MKKTAIEEWDELKARGKTIEWCAHCEYEVEIPIKEVSKCPKCGKSIRPCGFCPTNFDNDKRECDWKENGYCIMFPNFRYTVENNED
jgi:hypothetical protein